MNCLVKPQYLNKVIKKNMKRRRGEMMVGLDEF